MCPKQDLQICCKEVLFAIEVYMIPGIAAFLFGRISLLNFFSYHRFCWIALKQTHQYSTHSIYFLLTGWIRKGILPWEHSSEFVDYK